VRQARLGATAFIETLDHALGRLLAPLARLLPRRLRRAAELIERRKTRPIGQMSAIALLSVSLLYGLIVGGQIGRLADSLLVFIGLGIDEVKIGGNSETDDLTVLTELGIAGSLVWFDVEAAQKRVAALPWVERATVRKFYPSTLEVTLVERKPFALWQKDGEVYVIDRNGTDIVPLEESRFGGLPFVVGDRANANVGEILSYVASQPEIAEQMRAAVLVGGRRWDLHLDNNVTVKLPEKQARQALEQLVALNAEQKLLARDVVVIDLRLPDRITVRLPEGRTLEEVISDASDEKART
jgi:cell division protein FtsQ